jgi:hypothetical protein
MELGYLKAPAIELAVALPAGVVRSIWRSLRDLAAVVLI